MPSEACTPSKACPLRHMLWRKSALKLVTGYHYGREYQERFMLISVSKRCLRMCYLGVLHGRQETSHTHESLQKTLLHFQSLGKAEVRYWQDNLSDRLYKACRQTGAMLLVSGA